MSQAQDRGRAPDAVPDVEALAALVDAMRARVGAAQELAQAAGGDGALLRERCARAEAAIAKLSVAFGQVERTIADLEAASRHQVLAS